MCCMSTYATTAYQMFWVCGAQAHVSYISPLKMYSLSLSILEKPLFSLVHVSYLNSLFISLYFFITYISLLVSS